MKRVLIIAYYWPPSAGSGVQRWLKFSKYLPSNGWQPVIYTPKNPDFSIKDEGLLNEIPKEVEVIKSKIWEPYFLQRNLFGRKEKNENSSGVISQNKNGFLNYIANWIRGNLFVPDPKIFWRKPSVKFLVSYLKDNPVDVVISTGTPHSMHLIALDLRKKLNIPWIADFRDPWSELDMLKSYHILPFRMLKYRKLERKVLENADITLTTSNIWAKDLKRLGAKRVEAITNGYDEDDFNFNVKPYEDFVISHFGLLNHLRNPLGLWRALDKLCEEDNDFNKVLRLNLGGTIDPNSLAIINETKYLKHKVKVFSYIPHKKVVEEYLKSSVLLLLLFNSDSGKGNIPGKLFEYLAANKPIIAFGPNAGDSSDIIDETDNSFFIKYDNDNIEEIAEKIKRLFVNRSNQTQLNSSKNDAYSRKVLTKILSNLLAEISA